MFKLRNTLLLLFFGIIFFCFIRFGLLFDGLYGQDAYEYLRYTEALRVFFSTGKNTGDYFWGVYYPLFGSVLSFITPNIALALQLISVFSLIITSLYVDKIIRLIYKENSLGNITFLIFTLSPIVLIHSVLVMSDLLTCCFVTIAFYSLLQFLETSKNKHFLIGIAFCCFAILTRYASSVVLLPICIMVLYRIIKNRNYKILLYSIPIFMLIAVPHLLVRSQNSLQFLNHQWLQSWNIFNLFQSDFVTVDGEMNNHFINLIYVFFSVLHPIFMFIGILLIAFILKNSCFQLHKYSILLLLSILVYAFFLGGIPFQNKRFLLLSFPLIIIFLFPLLKKLFETINHPKTLFISIFIIQISLGIYFGKTFYERNLLEQTISKEMKQFEFKTLYVFDIDVALQGRKVVFNYKNLWKEKYTDFELNSLVLLNENQLKKQWKGKNPLLNWNAIQKKCVLIKLKTFAVNWDLYKIIALKK